MLKHSITIPNAPVIIYPGYRGDIFVFNDTATTEIYTVHVGDRVAQLIVARYESVEWLEGGVANSARGVGGFGSSGR